ncbi:DUF1793-domain-containing protein [Cubamyces sp. BRFM 1775]|nr:DUF1793-domain-containing protein [Cubamyces sp. BRFM 1775]
MWLALWLLSQSLLACAQSPVQTFFPAAIPLSIRSPYMSVWLQSVNGSTPLSQSWPLFWGLQSTIGWAGKIRVDGQTYAWLGGDDNPPSVANITNVQVTPTRSIFVMQAGPMNVTVTFLSPIEPSNWVLQSLPFSYVSVEASALDGGPHEVQVYSDIGTDWVSGDRGSPVQWSQHSTSESIYHEIDLQSPQQDVEINHQAQDGIAYYAMANRSGLTWQIDVDMTARGQFHDHGYLTNTFTTAFGPISPQVVRTVTAFSVDLGTSSSGFGPVTWAVGYVRNPSILYTTPHGDIKQLSPYFVTYYGADIGHAIDDLTTSFADIQKSAIAFDEAIIANASRVSSHYVDLLSLATRQTLGSLDITVSTDSTGQPNASDVRIFMKDVGAATTSTLRVTPVERFYASLPALLYVNASLVGPLLKPLLDAQDTLTDMPYAASDLGVAYPNATGVNTGHSNEGVEQTGNMLIMLYAHARFSGDGSLLSSHYNLTKRWADYLVSQALASSDQINADDEGATNTSNLAIKGIIGVKAMAEISRVLGQDVDAQHYDSHAAALVGSWQSLATSSDQQHILGTYGNQNSWALMYNIYADLLLGTNLISQTLLIGQTEFYNTLFDSARPNGIPLDSSIGNTTNSVAWQLFTAATVQDDSVRDKLIEGVWARANNNQTFGTFPDMYDASVGTAASGNAGPAAGGLYSILALRLSNVTIHGDLAQKSPSGDPNGGNTTLGNPNGSTATSAKSHRNNALRGIVGGAASVAVILVVALVAFLLHRRRRRAQARQKHVDESSERRHQKSSPYTDTPQCGTPMSLNPHSRPGEERFLANAHLPDSFATMEPIGTSYTLPSGSDEPGASTSGTSRSDPESTYSTELLSPGRSRTRDEHLGTRRERSGQGRAPSSTSDTHIDMPPTRRDVLGLRAAVENLRRALQDIRAESLEPPPEYSD